MKAMYNNIDVRYLTIKGRDGITNYPVKISIIRYTDSVQELLYESAIFVSEEFCEIPSSLKEACLSAPSEYMVNKQKMDILQSFV